MSEDTKYSKEQLLSAPDLAGRKRDVLIAALDDHKTYTVEEAKDALDRFKGGLF